MVVVDAWNRLGGWWFVVDVRSQKGSSMRHPNVRKLGRLGALVDVKTSDKLLNENITPYYAALQDLGRRIDGAGTFVYKAPLWEAFDALTRTINDLDTRLATLDAAAVNDWQADMLVARMGLLTLNRNLEAYTAKSNRAAIAATLVGGVVGGLTSYAVYRSKTSKKWAVFAGSSAAAASGIAAWSAMRP